MEPIEMRKHRAPLDDHTVERLLDLRMDPEDAPPGYAVDHALVGSMALAISTSPHLPSPRESTVSAKRLTAKVATAAAAVLFSTAGVAAATTGNLPDPAQDAVARAASHVGFDLPRSHDASAADDQPEVGDDGTTSTTVDDGTTDTTVDDHGGATPGSRADDHPTGNEDNPTASDQHGVDVSGTARSTDTRGRDHGQAVSEVAPEGHGADDSTTSTTEPGDDDAPETEGHGRSGSSGSDHGGSGSGHAEDNPSSGRRG